MKQIKLNKDISIDLEKLISGKLLIQANSGGGKSWLIRRIVEQAYGKVQIVILDPEGEFGTLREKYDFVLAGKGGDTPAEPKSAALLAQRLLELKVSTIIDLYELHPQERKRFVRLFLESMINVPKTLYHPVLLILDEAHTFAPEKGEAESLSAVVGMASLGRKREFSLIIATQRISKLHKDAAAECNNKLIGRASLDIDRKRAADELGITNKEEILALRSLKPGEFFAFGNAISDEVIKIKVGDVETSIPKGGKQYKVVPPTAGIRKVLGKLADLPEEAKKEAQSVKELKQEVATLRRHRCPKVGIDEKQIEIAVAKVVNARDREWNTKLKPLVNFIARLQIIITNLNNLDMPESFEIPKYDAPVIKPILQQKPIHTKTELVTNEDEKSLTGGALRMVKVLASKHPMQMTKYQLGMFARLKPTSGTFGTYLGMLRAGKWIEESGGMLIASQKALDTYDGGSDSPQSPEEVIEMWRGILKGGSRRMFDVLVDIYPEMISKEELAEKADLVPSSGTFGTYLGILRSNSLIDEEGGMIKASENIYA